MSCPRHMSGAKYILSQYEVMLFLLQAYGHELSEAYEWCKPHIVAVNE